MGFFGWFAKKKGLKDLCNFLKCSETELHAIRIDYKKHSIAKRSGGRREICEPCPELKKLQRLINYRLLDHLCTHKSCKGFEYGESIATNAVQHVNKAVVIKLDIRNFFATSTEQRIKKYFEKIGWNGETAAFLTRVTTFAGALPQGAPTSPRLSNLINYRLDARLQGLADYFSASYTRYADDLTFSLHTDKRADIQQIISLTRKILLAYGYQLNAKKTKVLRSHQQQRVTGLVVNQKARLPRQKRRWLRAVEHRLAHKGNSTISQEALSGWRNLENMIKKQTT